MHMGLKSMQSSQLSLVHDAEDEAVENEETQCKIW